LQAARSSDEKMSNPAASAEGENRSLGA